MHIDIERHSTGLGCRCVCYKRLGEPARGVAGLDVEAGVFVPVPDGPKAIGGGMSPWEPPGAKEVIYALESVILVSHPF